MDGVREAAPAAPGALLMTTHKDAANHARLSRADLGTFAEGLTSRLFIPEDGEEREWLQSPTRKHGPLSRPCPERPPFTPRRTRQECPVRRGLFFPPPASPRCEKRSVPDQGTVLSPSHGTA